MVLYGTERPSIAELTVASKDCLEERVVKNKLTLFNAFCCCLHLYYQCVVRPLERNRRFIFEMDSDVRDGFIVPN